MKQVTLKSGMKARIVNGNYLYKPGEIGTLVEIDSDGDWWANFRWPASKPGFWCIGKYSVDFVLLGEPDPEIDRSEFERWLLKEHRFSSTWNNERNCYDDFAVHLAFSAWSAKR